MLTAAVLALLAAASVPPPADLAASIEAHRKGDVLVEVTAGGKPVAGARVEIRQVRHAFLFGANIFGLRPADASPAQKAYQERFEALFNYATLPFYWGFYERERGQPDEARLRAMAAWCRAHGIRVKGHPVLWHEVFPSWVTADEPLEPLVAKRIAETVGGFRGLVDGWDVVNESVAAPEYEPANPWSLFVRRTGPTEVVDRALRLARAADPDAFLVVNDFKIVPEYERQLDELKRRGAPVQAIGIQSHMHGEEWPFEKAWEVCETYGRLGLPLHFTELTVLSGPKETPMTDYHRNRERLGHHPAGRGAPGRLRRAPLRAALRPPGGRGDHVVGPLGRPRVDARPGRARAQGHVAEARVRAAAEEDQGRVVDGEGRGDDRSLRPGVPARLPRGLRRHGDAARRDDAAGLFRDAARASDARRGLALGLRVLRLPRPARLGRHGNRRRRLRLVALDEGRERAPRRAAPARSR